MLINIIYTGLIIVSGIYSDFSNKIQRRNYIIFCSIILFLVAGLRNVMFGSDDTYLYTQAYYSLGSQSLSNIFYSSEKDPIFYCLEKIIYIIFGRDSYTPNLCVLASFFSMSTGYLIYKYSKNPMLSYVVLISMGFFAFSMNALRQMIAISLVLVSFTFIVNRSIIRFIITVFLASLFHKTALIFLLIYPFARMEFSIKTIWIYACMAAASILYATTMVAFIISNELLDDRLIGYAGQHATLSYSGMIQYILLFVLCCFYYKKSVKRDKTILILYNCLFFAIIFNSFTVYIAEFFRIAMYFGIFIVLLLPNSLASASTKDKNILTIGSIILLLIYFFVLGSGTESYRFYFQ